MRKSVFLQHQIMGIGHYPQQRQTYRSIPKILKRVGKTVEAIKLRLKI
jgi:hypothetical protein